jgi:competence protein ComEA
MNSEESGKTPLFERYRYVLTALLVVAIVGGSAVFYLRRPAPIAITIIPPGPTATLVPTQTPLPTSTPGPIQVYVTGAVRNPETVVSIPHGARVSDAIEAAGGLTEDADLVRVNMAQVLRDGDQVHVFAVSGSPAQAGTDASVILATPGDSGIVYINVATAEELEQLPRIGPAMAQRIIDYRSEHGPFTSLEDLQNVSGIGPATVEQMAPFVSFEFP